jgi:carbon-monoxide dehydrogenase medium subunit
MRLWNQYYLPSTVDEALNLLNQYAGQARVVAGGTDFLVELREGKHPVQEALIDITSIPELAEIKTQGNNVVIGAGVTHTQIVKSSVLAAQATCLVESCGVVGGPQVRNVGTLGGNVAHALPAGDGTTSLVSLDAEAEVVLDGERQWLSILDMFKGPGQSILDPTRDILLRFRSPLCVDGEATAFKRIMRPQGVALPVLGCAVWVRLDEAHQSYEAARICLAPVGPTPCRASEVEAALVGQAIINESIENAVAVAHDVLQPRTSKYRATADYRHEMISVLLRRTLRLAVERAKSGQATPEGVGI